MKKLFTLIALTAMLLGGVISANATPIKTLVYSTDYSSSFSGWNMGAHDAQNWSALWSTGMITVTNTENQVFYNVQFGAANNMNTVAGKDYEIRMTIDADGAGRVHLALGDWGSTVATDIDFTSGEDTYIAQFKGVTKDNAWLLAQSGTFVGTYNIKRVELYEVEQLKFAPVYNYVGKSIFNADINCFDMSANMSYDPATKQFTVGEGVGTLTLYLDNADFSNVTRIVNNFSPIEEIAQYLNQMNIFVGNADKGMWSGSKQYCSVAEDRRLPGITRIVYQFAAGKTFSIDNITLESTNTSLPVFGENGKAELNLDFIETTGAVTYDPVAKTITSKGAGSFYIAFPNMDFTEVNSLSVVQSGDDHVQSLSIFNSTSNWTPIATYYTSKFGANDIQSQSPRNSITKLVWNLGDDKKYGTEAEPKVNTITSISLTGNVITATNATETNLRSLAYKRISDGGAITPSWGDGATDATIYGTYDGNATQYADITDYEELRIYKANNDVKLRLFMIPESGTGSVIQVMSDVSGTWNSEEKYVSYNISSLPKYNDKVCLQAIKTVNNALIPSAPVTKIVLYKPVAAGAAQYNISGTGVLAPTATAALADATATLIDATGVTGTGVSLVSANPNCIVKANAGVLANANNVMVGTTIADLALTDGYPFAVPAGATATAATYTRAAGGTWGTICLPYAVASDANVQYYTLGENDGSTLVIETADNVAAGTPAIFKNLSGEAITFTGSGALVDNVDGSASTGTVLTMKGTYTQKVIIATGDLAKTYYISGDEVKQATASLTINPFRAYMEAAGAAPARIALREANNTTAINALFNAENSKVKTVAVYGVNGAQQAGLQKGINIVKFSDGTSKKVILK